MKQRQIILVLEGLGMLVTQKVNAINLWLQLTVQGRQLVDFCLFHGNH